MFATKAHAGKNYVSEKKILSKVQYQAFMTCFVSYCGNKMCGGDDTPLT